MRNLEAFLQLPKESSHEQKIPGAQDKLVDKVRIAAL
jgi:hypothetical protein